jgi:ectoine hydroxylase
MENGPLKMLPGSHLKGELTDLTHETNSWLDSLSKDLTYQVSPDTVDVLVEEHGLEYMTGKSGDVLMFDPMIVHSSSDNLSSSNRIFLIITFNAVSNAPPTGYHNIRPDFLCNRNSEPLMASKSAEYLKEKEVDQV